MMNTQPTPPHLQNDSAIAPPQESPEPQPETVQEEEEFALPEPDPDNIAVLTDKLPDTPILPWNRYDSPWREVEGEEGTGENGQGEPEKLTQLLVESEETDISLIQEGEEELNAVTGEEEKEEEEPEIDEVE
jgi:hypothetical protein